MIVVQGAHTLSCAAAALSIILARVAACTTQHTHTHTHTHILGILLACLVALTRRGLTPCAQSVITLLLYVCSTYVRVFISCASVCFTCVPMRRTVLTCCCCLSSSRALCSARRRSSMCVAPSRPAALPYPACSSACAVLTAASRRLHCSDTSPDTCMCTHMCRIMQTVHRLHVHV